MRKGITSAGNVVAGIEAARENVAVSFERFCLTAGVATLAEMMERDAAGLCGPRHGRTSDRRGHRWGRSAGKLGFHGGKVTIERPRVRARIIGISFMLWDGRLPLPGDDAIANQGGEHGTGVTGD